MRYAKQNILRLDINHNFLKNKPKYLGKITLETKAFVYPMANLETPLNFRITTVIMNENIEVVGYLSEFTAFLTEE